MSAWQTIETAPRDGTAVLVTDGQTQRVAWTQHPEKDGNFLVWCYYVTRSGASAVMNQPTHWMPLPAPPVRDAMSEQQPAPAQEIEAAWKMIEQCYHLEPREVIEREAKTNGFRFGLVQAIFSLWKREAKVDAQDAPAAGAQGTCATCRHWDRHLSFVGAPLDTGRCGAGVRQGGQATSGIYTSAAFGCTLHEPATPTPGAGGSR